LTRHDVKDGDGRERRWHARVAGFDFPAGADASDDFQAASALARAALLELADDEVREYLAHERSFSAAWREAATFTMSTIVATPKEVEQLAERIQELLAPYSAHRREGRRRGARFVHVGVRAVPRARP
jgi:hypothetical protein